MGFGGQQDQNQNSGYNQQLAAQDVTNKGYRARLVQWMMEIDDLSMMVERETLLGQFNRQLVMELATKEVGLWRAVRPQLMREDNKNLLGKDQKTFDYFEKYDEDIGLFLETNIRKDKDGAEYEDFENIDDLNRLHNILLLALTKLDILNSSVGY